jgi:DNA-binding transcriptional MerR regulator
MIMEEIPDKIFFSISEVSKIVGVKPYVLRYWENEFPLLRPEKNEAGQRRYRRKDVEMALKIKSLLYEQRYTIAGAKRRLKEETEKERFSISSFRKELEEMLKLLD